MDKKLVNFLSVTVGTFLLCLSVEMFILPYDILSGGVAGLGVGLYPLIHVDTTLFANVLTIVFLIIGRVFLGKEFFVNTCLSSVLYPVFNSLLSHVITVPVIDPAMASFYGGILGGAGIGLVMRTGASTGGMDVPPLILHKLTGIKVATLVAIVDGATVALGYFTYGIEDVLIGLVSVFATNYALSKFLSLGEGTISKSVQIISKEYESIVRAIFVELDRAATILDATGAYSGENKKLVLVVVDQKQYSHLLDIIQERDPEAFVITTDATDMHGLGFSYMARI